MLDERVIGGLGTKWRGLFATVAGTVEENLVERNLDRRSGNAEKLVVRGISEHVALMVEGPKESLMRVEMCVSSWWWAR